MNLTDKDILKRYYLIVVLFVTVALAIVYQLFNIQFNQGDYYTELAQNTVYKNFKIEPNRGNIYDANMNL